MGGEGETHVRRRVCWRRGGRCAQLKRSQSGQEGVAGSWIEQSGEQHMTR